MDREQIEAEINSLQAGLNKIMEKLIQDNPVAQNIVGQITAYRKLLVEEESCSESEKSLEE